LFIRAYALSMARIENRQQTCENKQGPQKADELFQLSYGFHVNSRLPRESESWFELFTSAEKEYGFMPPIYILKTNELQLVEPQSYWRYSTS
jgi:hypothetical protein